jgi:Uncharacterized protein conserved in bacteria (DUF2213)
VTTRRLTAAGLAALLAPARSAPAARYDRAKAPVVQRVDRWSVKLDKIEPAPNIPGMVDVWGVATRVGVFVYDDDESKALREYRPPDEVLDEASLASLRGVPFTLDHPADQVTSANASDLTHGWVLDVKPKGRLIATKIRIATDEAKDWIKHGVIELSCGYSARLDERSGVSPEGERYDAIQREIRYNHLALVDLARAGHVARLHLDGRVGVQRIDAPKRGPAMYRIRIDGRLRTLPAVLFHGLQAAVAEAEERGDAITTGVITIETDDDTVELVVPMATIEQVMGLLGASAEGDEPPAEAPPLEETAGDDLLGDAEGDDDDEKKADKLGARIASVVDRVLAKRLGGIDRVVSNALARSDARARERAELERQAATVLDPGYAYDKADDHKLRADVIGTADSSLATEATTLAAKARKGDQFAAGRLDAMASMALRTAAERHDSSGELVATVFDMRAAGLKASPEEKLAPWEELRKRRLDRAAGIKRDDDQAAS